MSPPIDVHSCPVPHVPAAALHPTGFTPTKQGSWNMVRRRNSMCKSAFVRSLSSRADIVEIVVLRLNAELLRWTPGRRHLSTKVHEGPKKECIGVTTIAVGTCLRHVLLPSRASRRADARVSRDAPGKKNPRPAESAAVCGGKLQSKRLDFGADCKGVSRLHTLLTHRNLRHAGRRLKRAFRFRNVLWLLSSKESNNKKNLCSNSALSLRHGVGRDAPV
jgi:hypothetical protein